jgi:hypothetical protein
VDSLSLERGCALHDLIGRTGWIIQFRASEQEQKHDCNGRGKEYVFHHLPINVNEQNCSISLMFTFNIEPDQEEI